VTDFDIRPFEWGDIPQITAIYRHDVLRHGDHLRVPSRPARARWRRFGPMLELAHPVYRGGERWGSSATPMRRCTGRARLPLHLRDTVYCAKDAQGQGVGTALMETIVDRARAFGFKQMIGVITAESKGSLRLHEKLGFRVVGNYEAVGFKFDRWLDIVHMQLAL
jgi:L-amino acid N-acyltransferase YncA